MSDLSLFKAFLVEAKKILIMVEIKRFNLLNQTQMILLLKNTIITT